MTYDINRNASKVIKIYQQESEVDPDSVFSLLENFGIVCIRGLINPVMVNESLKKVQAVVPIGKDMKRPSGGYDLIKDNYRRLLVGTSGGVRPSHPRLYRCLYNPLWCENIFGMHNIFRTMVRVRNKLLGEASDFAMDAVSRGVWTASRIQHYPRGGGFLSPHQDLGASRATKMASLGRTVNLLLLMTQYGVDFYEGGGFVEIDGGKFFVDENFLVGDLVLYDESKIHGVDDIDPFENLDLSSSRGRYAAFVTLFLD